MKRNIFYCVHLKAGAKEVIYEERKLALYRSEEEFISQKEGWMQEKEGIKLLWIKSDCKVADKFEIMVSY